MSLKLESLTEVSWLMFMLESEMLEMSEVLVVDNEDMLERDLDKGGDDKGSGP